MSRCGIFKIKPRAWVCPRPEQKPCNSCPAYEACLVDVYKFIEKLVEELPK